ncbi:MAG: HEAT repeat domain-containing protein [bacterium]|nr:HEAT repeat domain-containing protein [bacterium]
MLTNNATEKILPALRSDRPEAILQALDALQLMGQTNLRIWRELRRLSRHSEDAVAFRAATSLAAMFRRGTSPAMPAIVRLAPVFAPDRVDHRFTQLRVGLFHSTFREVHEQLEPEASQTRQLRNYWRPQLLEQGAASAETLIWLLKRDDCAAEFALRLLAEIGTPAARALDAVEALQSDDVSYALRLQACLALARLAPGRADESALQIIEFLRSPDVQVRRIAAEALHGIEHDLDQIVPAVAAAYFQNQKDGQLRDAMRDCLVSIGPPALPHLIRFLAIGLQEEAPENSDAAASDDAQYSDAQAQARTEGVAQLSALTAEIAGAHGATGLQTMLADCPHTVLSERRLIRGALRAAIQKAPDRLEELVVWSKASPGKTLELLLALIQLKLPDNLEASTVRPFVLGAVDSEDVETRIAAIQALGGRIGTDEALIETCIAWLSDPDYRIRESVANTLGLAGPIARKAIQPLLAALKDDAIEVRGAAAAALAKISPDAGVLFPDLMSAFHLRESGETAGKRASLHFLQHLGNKLADPNPRVVERTLEKVSELGHRSLGMLPALKICLRNEDLWVRARTLELLMSYGELAEDLIADVLALKSDPDWYVRQLVMQSLPALGAGVAAVPVLLAAMHADPHEDVRKEAVRSLGLLGELARTAAPELVRLLADAEQSDLHELADRSLNRIKDTETETNTTSLAKQTIQ